MCKKSCKSKFLLHLKVCNNFLGELDVDIQTCPSRNNCQENITWINGGERGKYTIIVEKYKGVNRNTEISLTVVNNGEVEQETLTLKKVKSKKSFYIIH